MALSGPLTPLAAASLVATAVAGASLWAARDLDPTEVVTLPAGTMQYRQAGDFLRDGTPVDAPMIAVRFERGVSIMRRQVSQSDYAACVADGACAPVSAPVSAAANFPVTGVSFNDAVAYAAWRSDTSGDRYRLPTDEEWAYAAGERFHDDALSLDADNRDPAVRWLAAYETESATIAGVERTPRPTGSYGENRNRLLDVGGNVWEWTTGCHVRHATTASRPATAVESCGVRIAEGRHRAYLSDFIREPRSGACSAGAPPLNLGIRLVREDAGLAAHLVAGLRHLVRPLAVAPRI